MYLQICLVVQHRLDAQHALKLGARVKESHQGKGVLKFLEQHPQFVDFFSSNDEPTKILSAGSFNAKVHSNRDWFQLVTQKWVRN